MPLLKKHWFNLALLALLFLALTAPELGDKSGPLHPETARTAGIVVIFFLTGLNLRTREIKAGLTNYRLHLFSQAFSFVFFPLTALLFYLAVRAWAPWLLPVEFLQGILALSVLPTTITSCVVFTTMARGNVAGAIFNAVLSNVAGVAVSPALFSLLLAKSTGVTIEWSQLTQIFGLILVPLAAGVSLRRPLGRAVAKAAPWFPYVSGAALLTIVFFALTSAFSPASPLWSWSPAQRIAPFFALVVLHFFYLISAWRLGKTVGLHGPDLRAAVFLGPQKTVALGLPLLQFFFAGRPELAGVLSIPLIFYHPLQLLVAGPLAARLATREQPAHAPMRQ